jgi:hypothetical protein
MQHAAHTGRSRLDDHRARVGFGLARVDDDGTAELES